MKKTFTLAAGLTAAILAGSAVSAEAAPPQAQAPLSAARLDFGPGLAGFDSAYLEKAQYLFGGRNYCFYLNGWRGPGYYWCGYANRRGLGWGGPEGWHGWRGGGHGGRGDYGRAGMDRGGMDRGGMNRGGFGGGDHMAGGNPGGGNRGGAGDHMGGGGHMDGGHGGGGHMDGGHGGGHDGEHHG